MSVRTPIEGLDSVENGGDVIDYLLDSDGLNYSTFVEVPSGIKRNQGRNDWYEAHLVDENGDGIIRYIELEASGDSPAFSDLKRHLKRHGSPVNELFTVIAYRKSDEGPLTSPLNDDLTFLYIQEQFSSEDVEVTFDLNYFTVKRFGVEPAYLDYLDDLTVDSGQGRPSLEGDIEDVFSIREVTQSFYQDFGEIFREDLQDAIHGLENPEENLNAYTRTVVNRVLFLLFVEEMRWLNGDVDYVENKYEEVSEEPDMHVYDDFFEPLFFEALSEEGTTESDTLGRVPFLNGGLFERKDIEENVKIDESFFDKLLSPKESDNGEPEGFLRRYKISLRESNPSEQELVVDPEFIGRIFEMFMQEDDRSDLGAFYTPKPITAYMTKNALKQHLLGQTDITEDNAVSLVRDHTVPESLSDDQIEAVDGALRSATVLDPAVGSGAFIIAMLEELVAVSEAIDKSTEDDRSRFQLKEEFIADTLYGVDIDAGGIELCKFRVWLHLIQDLEMGHEEFLDANKEFALPNLGFKFFVGNSLVGEHAPTAVNTDSYQDTLTGGLGSTLREIHQIRHQYQDSHGSTKDELAERLSDLSSQLETQLAIRNTENWMGDVVDDADSAFLWTTEIPEVILDGGFDIVIGNPPYEGQVRAEYKKALRKFYAKQEGYPYYAKTDLFQFFVHRARELASDDGTITYIMSDTFFTNINKTDVRKAIVDDVVELTKVSPNAFDASVETAIFVEDCSADTADQKIQFNNSYSANIRSYTQLLSTVEAERRYSVSLNGEEYEASSGHIGEHSVYTIDRTIYKNSINNSFFTPTETNVEFFGKFIGPSIETYKKWNAELSDTSKIRDSVEEIRSLIDETETGGTLPFGLLTEGGVGIQFPRNKDYIAVLEGTEKESRIREKGYYSRSKLDTTVSTDEVITDATILSRSERLHGVSEDREKKWVKVTRQAKGRDLFYCPTDEYTKWSKDVVRELKSNAKWQNSEYYLRSGIATKRGGGVRNSEWYLIEPSVFTSSHQVFIPLDRSVTPERYLLGIMNSSLVGYIMNNFLNRIGQSIRDVRRIPIKIPTESERTEIISLVDEAIDIQKKRSDVLESPDMDRIEDIQSKIDKKVFELYDLHPDVLSDELD
ncbi:N-6 DNA methylase [Haloferax volcanii]|uniref:site-specific DNA-methyltransferase (adenine-specific) n=2 Tax=Haloferax volcanii TaxID=2246 RepID=A0A6C0UXC2_HALVO|nr:N-6 DNA methylase [Haloferax alexandrinus]